MDKFTIKKESVNDICKNMYEAIALSSQFAFNLEQKEMYDELEILKRQTDCCFKVLAQTINIIELGKYNTAPRCSIFDVNEFVGDIVSACRSRIRKSKIKLEFEPYIIPLYISTDPDRFSACLLNMLVNALANVDREEGEVKISAKLISNDVCLTISDNGYGMTVSKATEYMNDNDSFTGFSVLKKFCETFGVSFLFETSENGGFSISLKIPMTISTDLNSNQVSLNKGTFSAVNVILSKLDFAEIDALY